VVTVLRILTALLLAAGTVVCGEVAWTIQRIRPKLEVTISNIDRATIAAGAAAGNLEKASRAWQQSSAQQASETTHAMSAVGAVAGQLSGFISRTDNSVNSQLLPALSNSITEQNAALLSMQRDLQQNLSQMAQATAEAQKVLADTDAKINSPDIQKTLDAAALSAQNLAVATNEAAATMKSVQGGVDYEVAQLEKPVKKVKVVFLFILTCVGRFFGFA
jgi:hypothetical protein